jgi:hypothetical protein
LSGRVLARYSTRSRFSPSVPGAERGSHGPDPVVAALLIFNRPLGFVAILGILALLGMIARNAVILIDQIEAERAEGKAIWDAMVDAAMSRFRPIELTAIRQWTTFWDRWPSRSWAACWSQPSSCPHSMSHMSRRAKGAWQRGLLLTDLTLLWHRGG